MDEAIGGVIVAILIVPVIFLICREIVCWYWKINRIVGLLESIESKLGGEEGSSAPGVR